MRLAIPIADELWVYYPLTMKKAADEEQFKKVIDALQKVENLLIANGKEGSPFALGTENPTQLDVHLFVTLLRIYMIKDSVWHDLFYVNFHFENYPHILKLIAGMKARPEFKGAIANPKPYHAYLKAHSETPAGHKV